MWDVVIAADKGFKGPSMHDLGVSLLQKDIFSIEEYLKDFKELWVKIGHTTMMDRSIERNIPS